MRGTGNNIKKSIGALLMLLVLNDKNVLAQKKGINAMHYEATYFADVASNYTGGLQTGTVYLGLIDLKASLKGMWKGGEIMVHMQNTHGGSPSGDLVGDLQVCNNIDNGDHSYLYELWYRQNIGKFSVLLGKHDLNSEFFTSDYGGEYLNSSFGIMPLVSINVPVSIFPKTGLGLIFRYDFSETFVVQTSLYDGDLLDLESDPYGVDFTIGHKEGYISFTEIRSKTNIFSLPGTYKFSYFYHTCKFSDITDENISYNGNWGACFIADQLLMKENIEGKQGLGTLVQCGISPKNRSLIDFYLALGLNYYGLIPGRDEDFCGISIAHASISNQLVSSDPGNILKHETAIEFIYSAILGDHVAIKPDLQYIINPGADISLNNALTGMLRFQITF